MSAMRVGILTGGGDCPGLNAVIRAVVLTGSGSGHEFVGFLDGWRGVLDGRSVTLEPSQCEDLLARGGTILGTSRTNPFKEAGGGEGAAKMLDEMGVEAVGDPQGVVTASPSSTWPASACPRRSTTT